MAGVCADPGMANGSGTVIVLKRAVTGADVLTVVQQLGNCVSSTGYRFVVRKAAAKDQGGG